MKIAILSRNKHLYSTRRLVQAGQDAGHEMHVIDTLRCYMSMVSHKPEIHFKGQVLEGFDAVIRTGEARDSRLMTRTLGTFRFHLVGAPAYFQRHGVPRAPEDLAGHRALRHRYPSTGKLEPWTLAGDDGTVLDGMTTVSVANAIEPLLFMAEEGHGLACLPDFAVRPRLAAGHSRPSAVQRRPSGPRPGPRRPRPAAAPGPRPAPWRRAGCGPAPRPRRPWHGPAPKRR